LPGSDNQAYFAKKSVTKKKMGLYFLTQLAEGRYLDIGSRVMLLRDAAAVRDVQHQTLVLETVPPGVNLDKKNFLRH
jgi:hypothetical protein